MTYSFVAIEDKSRADLRKALRGIPPEKRQHELDAIMVEIVAEERKHALIDRFSELPADEMEWRLS